MYKKIAVFNLDILKSKFNSISCLQLYLVSISLIICINLMQKQVTWPFIVWGWSALVFPL